MPTLSVNEILQDTLDAFKQMVPMLSAFSTDFSTATARRNDQIIAHISSLPTVQDYDATSGFDLNHAEADNLIEDVPVTLDQLKHVPVRIKYLTALSSKKDLYREAIRNQAFKLGQSVVDAALAKVTAANFTRSITRSIGNTSYDTVEDVRSGMNAAGAANVGRFGIVNTSFAGALQVDSRVASRDYHGQLNGSNGFRTFANVAGFPNIWEYPDLPTTGNLSAFFGDRRAITIATRLPDVQQDAAALGVPPVARFTTATDPNSGLSLLGIYWQKQGTFDVIATVAILYGVTAGTQGGSANAKTDKAGYRVVTA